MENNNGNIGIGVRKGAWSSEEDILLRDCIHKFGEGKWHLVPLRAGLNRCRKSCRLRWLNYLSPNLKRGYFGEDEVDLIIRLHKLLGNRWSLIAGRLPGRTANDVKNFWNTHISKKLRPSVGAVNRSNIVRPQPRTFSSLQLPLPAWSSLPTTSTSSAELIKHNDGDPAKSQPPTSSALEEQANSDETNQMEEDLDECMRWWGNLLDMTENDVHETPIMFSDDDGASNHDGGMCQIFQQQPLDLQSS